MIPDVAELAAMIDHSLLHPTMTDADLKSGCEIAAKCKTKSVCIKPYAVSSAKRWLEGTGVLVCSVIGFPHGSNSTSMKVEETHRVCGDGALEVDMVVNIGKVLGKEWTFVEEEIRAINRAAAEHGAILKVIFENDFLEDEHKIRLCGICSDAAVAFVKTSTGYGYVKNPAGLFSTRGATAADVQLMRKFCKPEVEVKAAGGIRTLKDMLYMLSLGATRFGATATEAILNEVSKIAAGQMDESELRAGSGGY